MGDTDNGEKPRGGRRWVCKALRLGMCRCVWADQPFSVSTNARLVSFKDEGGSKVSTAAATVFLSWSSYYPMTQKLLRASSAGPLPSSRCAAAVCSCLRHPAPANIAPLWSAAACPPSTLVVRRTIAAANAAALPPRAEAATARCCKNRCATENRQSSDDIALQKFKFLGFVLYAVNPTEKGGSYG